MWNFNELSWIVVWIPQKNIVEGRYKNRKCNRYRKDSNRNYYPKKGICNTQRKPFLRTITNRLTSQLPRIFFLIQKESILDNVFLENIADFLWINTRIFVSHKLKEICNKAKTYGKEVTLQKLILYFREVFPINKKLIKHMFSDLYVTSWT